MSRFLTRFAAYGRRHGSGFAEVSYEELYERGQPVREVLERKLAEMTIDPGPHGEAEVLERQDRASTRADKVENWTAFCAEAHAAGAEAWLERFEIRDRPTLDDSVRGRLAAGRARLQHLAAGMAGI
jgi:hypothetical protein